MAARKPPASKKATVVAAEVLTRNLLDYTRYAYRFYGAYTIENRAIPDFRDGLLPVQRRLIWAAHKMGNGYTFSKSAKLIGLTLGNYHPHGDSACYGAMVQMAQSPTPCIDGAGNWGSYDDPKSFAAMRYTEWRLTKFARSNFLTDSQLRVLRMVRNFDDTTQEPITLASNLPYLLLDGSDGMAVGVVTGIPTYTAESVAKLVALKIKGKEITPALCMKTLEFKFPFGGKYADLPDAQENLLKFYSTGSSTLWFDSDMELEGDTIIITGVSPQVNFSRAMSKTVDLDNVRQLRDETTLEEGTRIVIHLTPKLTPSAKKTALAAVKKIWRGMHFVARLNVTERGDADESGNVDVKFHSWSMPEFINNWVKWRLDHQKVEVKAEAAHLQERIRELELTILAAENWAVVGKSLEQEDSQTFLSKKLKISYEDANTILHKVLLTLKKTNVTGCRQRIKEMQARIKELKSIHSNPAPAVLEAMNAALSTIGADVV